MPLWLGAVLMIADAVLLAVLLSRIAVTAPATGIARAARASGFWVAAVLGGLVLWVTLKVQPPIQIAYGRWIGPATSVGRIPEAIAGFGTVLISGLVQEALKLLAILAGVWALRLLARPGEGDAGGSIPAMAAAVPALGAAAGCAFGIVEAIVLVVLPNVRAGQAVISDLAVIERIFAIMFHAGSATMLGVGVAKRKAVIAYGIAALLHGLLNYGIILRALWILDVIQLEVWVAVGSVATLGLAWWWASTLRPALSHESIR